MKILLERTRAQESRAAIERMYITMRHLFQRGYYKPLGKSGEAIIQSLLILQPEIYGSIADTEKVELNGLHYVFDRLPRGIEECRYIKLASREGYGDSHFKVIVPPKRRRNCYRIDPEEMVIELTRGRSEIYDILTHLTFLYIEAEKIRKNALEDKGKPLREWLKLEEVVLKKDQHSEENELLFTYLATLLGRTYEETELAFQRFEASKSNNGFFHVIYWLGRRAMEEQQNQLDREITFTPTLRERIGHHLYGEIWADHIKRILHTKGLLERPVHILSANLHSVINTLYAGASLGDKLGKKTLEEFALHLSEKKNEADMQQVLSYAQKQGVVFIEDKSGTNLGVQIIDLSRLDFSKIPSELEANPDEIKKRKPILLVMDYPFGEQAYEIMDELLKPVEVNGKETFLQVESISVMGKAGILTGGKGDIMVPNAHIFEGTADNYPFKNDLSVDDFKEHHTRAYSGAMITVLGTSLQNKDILTYFRKSSWKVIGLEMEGAHLQKAIQAASQIRNNIRRDVILRYAYYASDNPLKTGSTLASGSLGRLGVKPTYLISRVILSKILCSSNQKKNS